MRIWYSWCFRDWPAGAQHVQLLVSRAGALTMAMSLAMVDSDFVNYGRSRQSVHRGKTALTPAGQAAKCLTCLQRDFSTKVRSASQRLCHMSANKTCLHMFLVCAGAPHSRKVPTLTDWGHHVGTTHQHQSSPSFTSFEIVATRFGFVRW